MPGIVLSILQILIHLFLLLTLRDKYHYYLFVRQRTLSTERLVTCPRLHSY